MKKTARCNLISAILCLLCALLLYGCGGSAVTSAENSTAAETPAPVESTAPSATLPDANLQPAAEPSAYEIAQEYIDRPLEDLIAAIGEPLSSAYGPSCWIADGEDGQLQYDGFWVSTLKDGESETVNAVVEGDAY